MILVSVPIAEIPEKASKTPYETVPRRYYEAALLTFWESGREAVRIEDMQAGLKSTYNAFLKEVNLLHLPVTVMIRQNNVYLVREDRMVEK